LHNLSAYPPGTGELGEVLRIRSEEQLLVYEKLGDVRSLLIGRANLSIGDLRGIKRMAESRPMNCCVWTWTMHGRCGFPKCR
jgi:hypothetical protein